jgi:hypothetical protein
MWAAMGLAIQLISRYFFREGLTVMTTATLTTQMKTQRPLGQS